LLRKTKYQYPEAALSTSKKIVALKKVRFFFSRSLKKSTKINSVKLRKKNQSKNIQQATSVLKKKCLLSNKNYKFDLKFVAKKIWKKMRTKFTIKTVFSTRNL